MISEDLHLKIKKQLYKKTGKNDWVITGPEIEARECLIFKASSSTHPHDIAIKTYRDFKEHTCISQYDALEYYASLLNTDSSKFRVPIGYGSFPEYSTFLMEWIKSPALQWRLWRYFYNKYQQQSDIRRTFGWLKAFHNQAAPEIKPVNIESYKNTLQKFLICHEGEALLSTNEVFKNALECFRTLSPQYDGLISKHAKNHGDFTTSNVLIDDKKVTAIDMYGNSLLPVVNDIALQVSYIVIEFPNMLSRFHLKKPTSQWEIPEISLEAYGFPQEQNQRNFFLLIFLFQLLRRWLVINHRNKLKKTPLLDRWRLKNSEMIVKGLSKILLEIHQ